MNHLKAMAVLCLFTAANSLIYAQHEVKPQFLILNAGSSGHGTGDMPGGIGGIGYQKTYNRWLAMQYQLNTTIHGRSGAGGLGTNPATGEAYARPYFITAGVQAEALPVITLGGQQEQWFNVLVGPMVRWQLSGYPDTYAYQAPGPNGGPGSYQFYEGRSQSLALGYVVALQSQLLHRPKWSLGVQARFQNDTQGDVITSLGVVWQYKTKGGTTYK
ncbi:MAG TPA: hypothetical protein PKD90_02050 [Phnomibacter sp.]|nr:hypothetical protein [Phnomibacter sp.]